MTSTSTSSSRARRRASAHRTLGEPFAWGRRTVVALHAGQYRNGQVRIDIVDERTGTVVLTPTVPVDRIDRTIVRRSSVPTFGAVEETFAVRSAGVAYLSDAGPNRGIVAELEKAGVVSDTGRMIDDRRGRLHVCSLLAEVAR